MLLSILTIIIFILILSILVLVHEFGHFLLAKKSGIEVQEFGIGFPPKIFSKKYGETTYSINAIPFGGFVKMLGEEGEDKGPRSFFTKPIGQRALVLFAGVGMNFLLAVLIFSFGFWLVGLPIPLEEKMPSGAFVKSKSVVISDVLSSSPAEKSGIKAYDIVLALDNQPVKDTRDVQDYVQNKLNQEINVSLERDGKKAELKVTPQKMNGETKIGIGMIPVGIVSFPILESLKIGFLTTLNILWFIIKLIFHLVRRLFIAPEITSGIAGPIGIYFIIKQAVQKGLPYILSLTAQISAIDIN